MRPSALGIVGLFVVGLFLGIGLLATVWHARPLSSFISGVLFSALLVGALYLAKREAWHRAAGWHGPEAEARQWAASGTNPELIGRLGAMGGALGGPVLLILGWLFGVEESALVGALAGALGGFFLATAALWSYLLQRAKQYAAWEDAKRDDV